MSRKYKFVAAKALDDAKGCGYERRARSNNKQYIEQSDYPKQRLKIKLKVGVKFKSYL